MSTSEKETTCSGQLLMKIVLAVLRLVGVVKDVEPEHAPLQVPYRCPWSLFCSLPVHWPLKNSWF